jgi:drug/metabolite transporter (DMT)-like permease
MNPQSRPSPPVASATIAGAGAIALWSTLAVLTTWTGDVPPLQLLASSFLVAGLLSLLIAALRGDNLRQALTQPWPAFALTTSALFGYHGLYFLALKSAPPIEASLINYLWPLLIVLFIGLLPGERLRPVFYPAALLGLLGALIAVGRGEWPQLRGEHLPGYLSAAAAAVIWAGYSVLNRRYARVPTTAIALPCLAVAGLALIGHVALESTVMPSAGQWLAILALGLGPAGIAFWLWDRGTKHGHLALLGTLAYAVPVFSTAWLLLAGQGRAHWSQAVACALIVVAGVIAIRATRSHRGT